MLLRAAFDLGSGASKLAVALVEADPASPGATRIGKVLYGKESEVLLGHAVNQASDKMITPAVEETLMKVMRHYASVIADVETRLNLKADRIAVATAVYREAANGDDVLRRAAQVAGIRSAVVLSQDDEGLVGFMSGCAAAQDAVDASHRLGQRFSRAMVWDSGGSSFQLTFGTLRPPAVEATFGGRWGSSKAVHAMLTQVQNKPQTHSPNPVSTSDATRLIEFITKDLINSFDVSGARQQLQRYGGEVLLIGIGGPTSAHRMAHEFALAVDGDGFVERTRLRESIFTSLCGKSDDELSSRGFPQREMVLPKLCLIVAVMELLGIDRFMFRRTMGSTLGILTHAPLWETAARSNL